jgi:hypothetical protein
MYQTPQPTPLLIKSLFVEFNGLTTEVYSLVDNLDGTYSFGVCNKRNLIVCSIVFFDGLPYEVTSINGNIITVSGGSVPVGEMTYPVTYFFNGTPIMVGNELDRVLDASQKTPMAYLYEPLTDDFNDEESMIERDSRIRLFFLDQSNFMDWDTEQHYSGAVQPMYELAQAFVAYLRTNGGVGELGDYSITYIPNFSIVRNQNGTTKKIFNDDLSGVELSISIPFLKSYVCLC